jgi:hypothetical protein
MRMTINRAMRRAMRRLDGVTRRCPRDVLIESAFSDGSNIQF